VENNLRILRAMRNITQENLASSVGVTRQTILAIENGKYNPSLELAFKIAEYFETTIEKIFLYKEVVHT
jgi:putative transcriptional regulator